jgi:subtilisin family serine protease
MAKDDYSKTELFVKVKEGSSLPSLTLIQEAKNLFGSLYLVKTSNVDLLAKKLEASAGIEYVERNYRSQKRELPTAEAELLGPIGFFSEGESPFNDPRARQVWSFKDAAQNGIGVNKAYTEGRGQTPKAEIIVAVVDTGVDYNHEDLKDIMWVNSAEIAGNGIDDDGNGYIDDVHGIDTLDRNSEGKATGDPMDTHNHGSHVSGTIAAKQNNNIGIAGIASNVKIMAIRTVPNNGDETDIDVVESFLYAAKHGAKLINCSFGKAKNEGGMVVSETIKHIGEEYGVLVIAAAGNSTSNNDRRMAYPASFDNDHLLVVASTSSSGRFSSFSNYGPKSVDVAAPGSRIHSTIRKDRYASYSGTSMASPTTAGLAAEVLAHNPELGPLDLKARIMETVEKRSSYKGRILTGGLVNLYNALMQ